MTEQFYYDNEMNEIPVEETEIITVEQTNTIGRGKEAKEITLNVPIRVIKGTKNEVSDNVLDDATMKNFFEEYRKQNSILSPDEIKNIRNSIGISQRGLANLVGWSSSTIERYERGSVATPVNHRVLLSLRDKDIVKMYFDSSKKENYSSNDFQVLNNYLSINFDRAVFLQANDVADWFIAESAKEQKIDSEASPMTQMKLQKLVYFAQRDYMQTNHSLLFEENTLAFTHGCYYQSIGNAHHGKYIFEKGEEPNSELATAYLDKQKDVESDENVRKILNDVWEKYSVYEAWYLRKLNHTPGGAWDKNYNPNEKYIIIPNEDILAEEV